MSIRWSRLTGCSSLSHPVLDFGWKPLMHADLKAGSPVEKSFRLLPQDQAGVAFELERLLGAAPPPWIRSRPRAVRGVER
jgi:hypothetical protein